MDERTTRFRSLLQDIGLFILRVSTGAMMIYGHGWPKLMSYTESADTFADPLGLGSSVTLALAIFAELFCAALLILGAFTRLAVIPLLITMLTAVFVIHIEDPWPKREFALLYAVPFATLLFTGAGRWSVDHLLARKYRRRYYS